MSATGPLCLQKYTDKSIVVRGDTKPHKDLIKTVSGYKFGYYGGVPGWMFPLTQEAELRETLKITTPYVSGPAPNLRDKNFGTQSSTEAIPLYLPSERKAAPLSNTPQHKGLRGHVVDPEAEEAAEGSEIETLKARVLELENKLNQACIDIGELKSKVVA